MRAYILATCLACSFAMPGVAAPADREAGVQQAEYREVYRDDYGGRRGRWGYGPDCRELRRACLYKEDLGEVGRGNCQRYRSLCR